MKQSSDEHSTALKLAGRRNWTTKISSILGFCEKFNQVIGFQGSRCKYLQQS